MLCGVGVVAAATAWTVYLLHVGLLDARDLSAKTTTSRPVSALDWPEIRIENVLEPDNDGVVLMTTCWPAHVTRRRLMLLRLVEPEGISRLTRWHRAQAPVSTYRRARCVEFRRRHSIERVRAVVLDEHAL